MSPRTTLRRQQLVNRHCSPLFKKRQQKSTKRMLYIIGLGLGDEKDITLKGLEAVRKSDKVYIEAYTSLLSFGISSDGLSNLEKLYGKSVIVADREMVEEKSDGMLSEARHSDVSFLVVGDPFGATTHSDLVVRAKQMEVEVKVIHNASVMNAIGICGLQLYRYGEAISIPFFTETWKPNSFYGKIKKNRELGLHTLCLLDIKVKEPSLESLCRGKKVYEPPRFMSIATAIEQLLEVEQTLGESAYNEDTTCVGFARLGSEDQIIVSGSMRQLLTVDFGAPLHCLTIVGDTHPVEDEMLRFYAIKE
ncbi:putative diphthine methyl ester synthase isoform X1 [Silene latifolia]|uniref:putative diphthine methyl ester synthase isoform X1 n=2 Tax=Silene latifolia TaxID=37657 RepID=UPI003D76E320